MAVAHRVDQVLGKLLPRVMVGVEQDLRAVLSAYGSSALVLVERSLPLLQLGAELVRECVREDRLMDAATLDPFAAFGHLVARRGHTAHALRVGVTTSYTSAIRIALATAPVEDRAALMPLVTWAAQVGPRIEQTELNAFLSWHNQSSDDSRYRQELVRALLSGGAQVAQPRPPGYLVALLAPPSPGPGEVDRIGRELLASDALVLPRPEFVVLMHPLRDDELDRLTPLTRMPPEIEGLAGRLRIALARGRADAVPAAYREAVGVWRTLRQRDYPPGRYELTDVLTDRLLARDRHAAQVARELIAPIAASPELVHTLRHWILGDADRSRVAAALGVHPNTLDRRLRQIERRTGLTVGRHHGLHLLHLGLAADWPPRTS